MAFGEQQRHLSSRSTHFSKLPLVYAINIRVANGLCITMQPGLTFKRIRKVTTMIMTTRCICEAKALPCLHLRIWFWCYSFAETFFIFKTVSKTKFTCARSISGMVNWCTFMQIRCCCKIRDSCKERIVLFFPLVQQFSSRYSTSFFLMPWPASLAWLKSMSSSSRAQ